MKPTIAALWHETLSDTDCFLCTNPLIQALEEDTEHIRAQLSAGLDAEQAETFAVYVRSQKDLQSFAAEQAFVSGFRTAARLMAEVYTEE